MNLHSARARRFPSLLALAALTCALRPVSAQVALHPPPPLAAEKATPEQTAPEKRQFHLFQPTPRASLRDLSADRPDTTESPITVDAGRWQIEASFFDYGRDETGRTEEEVFTYGALNLSFSDAAFGFALTLLVVSLEVPRTFADLKATMLNVPAFAVCFVILILIWEIGGLLC
ncbi:MAG: DUF1211 domain-containing protein [Blastocatellia bacterium]|nr:DUF1211 domain-containing protein [Blastocatellia bacterium]